MTTERSQKANEIIACTRQLLTSGGYRSFSFADISEKVNIRKASIHHHFASKAELVRRVVSEYRIEARTKMQALSRQASDPVIELHAYVDYWANCIHTGQSPFCICVMLAVEMPALPPEVADEVSGYFADLNHWLIALLKRGEQEKRFHIYGTPSSDAGLLMATVHGAMLAARVLEDDGIFQRIVQPIVGNIIREA